MDPYGKVPGRPEGAGPDRDAEDGRDSDTRGKSIGDWGLERERQQNRCEARGQVTLPGID